MQIDKLFNTAGTIQVYSHETDKYENYLDE
jgi:hypothetical protein